MAAALLVSLPSQAQIKFGIRGGANLVNLKTDGSGFDKSNRMGFYVGPTVKFTVPVVGLSLDLSALYDQKNAKIGDESFNSQCISIPLNVRYGYGFSSLLNVFAFTGPQYSFNVGGDKNLWDNASEWTWKSSQFSWNVGIGATLFSHVEVKANYNIACTKTGEVKSTDVLINGLDGKYNSWQVGLAYYF